MFHSNFITVITNDGDALIYGAQCIYTNFTLEGLSQSTIIRYNAADLKVLLPSNDESNAAASVPRQSSLSMSMEREDLIAFALLTGSDLAGEGVPHVGPKKALQLLHGCKTSLITECPLAIMSTWREQSSNEDDAFDSQTQRRCTTCLHPGDCRQHKAKGCMLCGTSENQPCIPVSEKDKFRRKICKKTKMLESFAGQEIIDAYLQKDVQQKHRICPPSRPRLDEINRSQIIVSGRSQESSQAFVIKVVSRLLARFDLINCKRISPTTGTKLVAQRISKALVHKGYPCYEIQWFIPDFEFYFSSFEWQKVAVAPLSNLVEEFKKRERQIFQRKNDDNRIVMFTGVDVSGKQRTKKASRKRTRVFGRNLTSNTMNITDSERSSKKQGRKTKRAVSMDISMLLHSVDIGNKKKSSNRKDLDLDEDNSTLSSKSKSEILENHDNDDTNYTGGTESRALENINNNESSYYSPLPSTFTVYESPESIAMSSLEKNKIHHDSPKMPTLGRHGIGVTVKLGIPVKLSPIVVRHRSIFGDHDTIVS